MPVTITAGITFSGGGLDMTFAPPSGSTAGWFGGGSSPSSTVIQRITFATDTATSTVRGPLNTSSWGLAAAGTDSYGWFGGGYNDDTVSVMSTVQRITFATDTNTATVKGPLSTARRSVAATGNTTDGWWAGGYTPGSGPRSLIDRVTYATDTATASVRGQLNEGLYRSCGTGTQTETYGWYYGGRKNTPAPAYNTSRVQRITYASDTATASIRGPLNQETVGGASTGNSTDSWISTGAGGSSTVERVTFATDTATASVRGPLTAVSYVATATGSSTYGYFAGISSANKSLVNRITFATDTATATVVGLLTVGLREMGATSGIQ